MLLNLGNGVFGAAVQYATGPYSFSVAVADLNGDGRADLVTANYNVSVLLNQGDGTFGSTGDYGVGWAPYSVVAADFNGDGRPDLVTANNLSNNVSMLLTTCLP